MAGRMVSNPLLNNYKKSQVDDLEWWILTYVHVSTESSVITIFINKNSIVFVVFKVF